jgi:hypothetical protein
MILTPVRILRVLYSESRIETTSQVLLGSPSFAIVGNEPGEAIAIVKKTTRLSQQTLRHRMLTLVLERW